MEDYLEKPKKKKKRDKEEHTLKPKPTRNFKIIDDDININDLKPNEEAEMLADLLDPEGPVIAHDVIPVEKPKENRGIFVKNKWVTLDFSENDDSNPSAEKKDEKSLFKKRGEKASKQASPHEDDGDSDLDTIPRKRPSKNSEQDLSPVRFRATVQTDEDGDLDTIPRRSHRNNSNNDLSPVRRKSKTDVRTDSDGDLDVIPRKPTIKKEKIDDLSPVRSKKPNKSEDDSDMDIPRKHKSSTKSKYRELSPQKKQKDLSPVRSKQSKKEDEPVDETKVRVRKMTVEEETKKAKNQELKAKYADWGRGLVQKKEQEEKIKDFIYEADKPLARYADDRDLDRLLKNQEREDDPMLEYLRKNKSEQEGETKKPAPKYRGPPPPPNRYNILPGSKWDGVDRSNGFEKKYYESITARKAFEQEAYKWSTEDM